MRHRLIIYGLIATLASLACRPDPTDSGTIATPFSVVGILHHDEALHEAHDVLLQNDLAFVPGKGGSIAIIDVADSTKPELLWYRHDHEALGDSETVLVEPGRLYLGTVDFHSVDISDPRTPTFEGSISDRPRIDRINGMVRSGDYIFAANKEGWIDAFDVSKPGSPKLSVAVETREAYSLRYPHDIDLLGNLIVVVDPNRFGLEGMLGRLAVFRVFEDSGELRAGEDWELVSLLETPSLTGANRVQVRDNYAFVGASLTPDASRETVGPKGIVVDLAEPTRPTEVATVDFPDVRGPNGLVIAGDVWFLAGGQTIEAYDISKPRFPRKLATFHSEDAFPTADDNAHDLVYRDGLLYVTSQGDNSFVILAVEDSEIRRLAGP